MLHLVLLVCLTLTTKADLSRKITRPVDLSHPFDEKTIYAFRNRRFQFISTTILPEGRGNSDWFATNDFETAEHGGTHMDAPYHFNEEGLKIGEIPFERFFGKAVYLNLRDKAEDNINYGASATDFQRWERQNGPIPCGSIVMLDFGWAQKYDNINDYLGTADVLTPSTYRFPGLSESGAQYLVQTGKVYGVGTDATSIDVGIDMNLPAHTILTENNLYILEQVALPQKPLGPCGYDIHALPMKIRNGTGAACRVVAFP